MYTVYREPEKEKHLRDTNKQKSAHSQQKNPIMPI